MLADKGIFDYIENELLENGTIEEFEKENGKITGRMMITLTEVPEGIQINKSKGERYHAFECSFDFYDASLGIALNTETLDCLTGMWVTPQKDTSVLPTKEWKEFFIETLVKYIDEDGNFSVPICVLLNDHSDLSVVPTT